MCANVFFFIFTFAKNEPALTLFGIGLTGQGVMKNHKKHNSSEKSRGKLLPRGGLAMRYTRFFILAFLLVFSIAFYYTFKFTRRILDEDAHKRATEITDLAVSRISSLLKPAEQVPYTLSLALDNERPNYSMILGLAREFVLDDTVVFGSAMAFEPYMHDKKHYRYCPYVFESKNKIEIKDLSSAGYDYFSKDWYRIPKLLQKPVWSEPYYDKGGGDTLMCTYSVPFYHQVKGQSVFAGVITMDISLGKFKEILRSAKVSETGVSYLLSHNGKLITPIDDRFVNMDIRELILRKRGGAVDSVFEKMLRGEKIFQEMNDLQYVKVPSWISSAPVPHTNWIFAVTFPTKELHAGLNEFFRTLAVIFCISLLAMAVLTVLITNKFISPISRLVEAAHRIGQGDFQTALPVYRSKDEISELTNAFSGMKEELVQYIQHLQEATVAREKIESELSVAHDIQMGMLPRNFPVRDDWELAASLDPAKAVGGDLYDFYFLDDNHLFIAIGDVAGKGVPASLFMVVAKTLFRSRITLHMPLNQIMYEINKEICKDNPNQMFITFIAGIVDLENATLTYCNAGHNPPFLIRSHGNIEKLSELHGIPLGIFEHAVFSSGTILLLPGDTLLLYTDGVTEAINSSGAFYTVERMLGVIRGNPDLCPAEMLVRLKESVRDFMKGTDQADDITLLALHSKLTPGKENKPSDMMRIRLANQLGELGKLVAMLEQVSEVWNIPAKVTMELNLVLEELFTNIVFYAFDDGHEHEIIFTFERTAPGTIHIQIEDDGKPFNLLEKETGVAPDLPLEERKVGGLGIHFVKKLVNEISYERKGKKNVVLLIRKY